MSNRDASRYAGHPRITWFGTDGTVAYVDYVSATESYFIGGDGQGGFKVIEPSVGATEGEEHFGFSSIDAGIEYALQEAGR